MVYCNPEVEDAGHNVCSGLPFYEVIQPTTQKDPHWPDRLAIVEFPGILQLWDGCTTDCQPVNVNWVRRAAVSVTPGVVDVVEVTVSNQDVKPLLRPGSMSVLAGSTHILQVLFLVFYALQNPYFAR